MESFVFSSRYLLCLDYRMGMQRQRSGRNLVQQLHRLRRECAGARRTCVAAVGNGQLVLHPFRQLSWTVEARWKSVSGLNAIWHAGRFR